jgi:hypothetical protein
MFLRSTMLALATGALALMPMRATDLPTQLLPVFGGSGGTAFSRDCGAGRVLTGLRYRSGLVLDAVGLLCRPLNADGSLGSETTVGTLAGGGGGTSNVARCASNTIVRAAYVYYGSVIDGIKMQCYAWDKATRSSAGPLRSTITAGSLDGPNVNFEICEANTQPAAGIRGRAGLVVDAIGFTCDEP